MLFLFFVKNNIKFCFVYPNETMQKEISRRMSCRGNSHKFVKENEDMFQIFLDSNRLENKSVVHYEFNESEYLEEIIKKFGYKF